MQLFSFSIQTFLILVLNFFHVIQTTKFDIQIKSARCIGYPKYFYAFDCEVKPIRRKPSIINFIANFSVTLTEIHYQFTIYYMYGTIYRTFLVDFSDVDHCELMLGKGPYGGNPIIKILITFISTYYPGILHGCPYYGTISVRNLDVNATLGPLLPPVIPQGQYKVYFRYFSVNNDTIAELIIVGVVKPNLANRVGTDFSMG